MDAFILACLVLRWSVEEKHIPEPEFQPFRLEYLYPVNENHDDQSTLQFNQGRLKKTESTATHKI